MTGAHRYSSLSESLYLSLDPVAQKRWTYLLIGGKRGSDEGCFVPVQKKKEKEKNKERKTIEHVVKAIVKMAWKS